MEIVASQMKVYLLKQVKDRDEAIRHVIKMKPLHVRGEVIYQWSMYLKKAWESRHG